MLQVRRLIIVDDDPDVLNALRFAFETEGYVVRTHTRGEDVLAEPPLEPGTCLVIDERLPGITGLETVSRLRDLGITAPAILITTHPTGSMIKRAVAAQVGIVEKPLVGDALASSIRDALA